MRSLKIIFFVFIFMSCGDSSIIVKSYIKDQESKDGLVPLDANFSFSGGTIATNYHPYSKWGHRLRIDFDPSFLSQSIEDFPIMVRLNPQRFDYSMSQSDGRDIRFSDAEGNILPYEIASWNPVGESIFWVKLSLIDLNSTKKYFYLYASNPTVTSESNPSLVWSGYSKVLHLDSDVKNSTNDTIALEHNVSDSTGIIGGAKSFMATEHSFILVGNSKVRSLLGSACLWMKSSFNATSEQMLFYSGTNAGFAQNQLHINLNSNEQAQFWGAGGSNTSSIVALNDSNWHFLCYSWNSISAKTEVFVDGVLLSSVDYSLDNFELTYIQLGANSNKTREYTGQIDEFMLKHKSLSSQDVLLFYKTMKDEFLTFGEGANNIASSRQIGLDINFSRPATEDLEFDIALSGSADSKDYKLVSEKVVILKGQEKVKLLIDVFDSDKVIAKDDLNLTISDSNILVRDIKYDLSILHNRPPTIAFKSAIYVNQASGELEVDVIGLGDTDPDGEDLVLRNAHTLGSGNISIVNNTIRYTPHANFSGVEKITYVVADEQGVTSLGEVIIKVMTPTTWTGKIDNDFSNPLNWCGIVVSGECQGGDLPNTVKTARFDGTCTNCNVTLSQNINIFGMYLDHDYVGTVNTNNFDIILRTGSLTQLGGSFIGTTGNITASYYSTAPFLFLGGNFIAPSSNLIFRYNLFISDSVNFNHNNGTFLAVEDCGCGFYQGRFFTQNHYLYNLTHNKTGAGKIYSYAPVKVENDFIMDGQSSTNMYLASDYEIGGNLYVQNYLTNYAETYEVSLTGVAEQTVSVINGNFLYDTLIINKPSGSVKLLTDLIFVDSDQKLKIQKGSLLLNGYNLDSPINLLEMGDETLIFRDGGLITDPNGPVPDGPYDLGDIFPSSSS